MILIKSKHSVGGRSLRLFGCGGFCSSFFTHELLNTSPINAIDNEICWGEPDEIEKEAVVPVPESLFLAPSQSVNHSLAMLGSGDGPEIPARVHPSLSTHGENCKNVNVLSVFLLHAQGEDTVEGLSASVNGKPGGEIEDCDRRHVDDC